MSPIFQPNALQSKAAVYHLFHANMTP
jgi:hypothetical protein